MLTRETPRGFAVAGEVNNGKLGVHDGDDSCLLLRRHKTFTSLLRIGKFLLTSMKLHLLETAALSFHLHPQIILGTYTANPSGCRDAIIRVLQSGI